jgi:hypothetical protein
MGSVLQFEDDMEAVLSGKPFVYCYHEDGEYTPHTFILKAHSIQNPVMVGRFFEGFCPSCEKKLQVCTEACKAYEVFHGVLRGLCFCIECSKHFTSDSGAKVTTNLAPPIFEEI